MKPSVVYLQLPIVCFVGALAFLVFARIFWSPAAYGLLSLPLFFACALLATTLVFYYIILGYLLLRTSSAPPA